MALLFQNAMPTSWSSPGVSTAEAIEPERYVSRFGDGGEAFAYASTIAAASASEYAAEASVKL